MTSHVRNPTIDSFVNLFTLQTTPTEGPLPSFNSIEHSSQVISKCLEEPIKSTSRRQLRKAPSELLKNNILRIKQSERICKLKEQTSSNVQMFLRIKAQASHYKLKDVKR